MEKLLSSMSYDDIIFDGRNQAYGAYQLRKLIDRHHGLALIFTFTAFVVLLLIFKWNLLKNQSVDDYKDPIVFTLTDINPIVPEFEQLERTVTATPASNIAQTSYREYIVRPDDAVVHSNPTTVEDILSTPTQIGWNNTEDIEGPAPIIDVVSDQLSSGPSISNTTTSDAVDNNVYDFVQEQPEFPGGLNAMHQFIYKNIHYPQVALESDIEGVVTLEFVIDKDGSVTDVKIIKDPGGGLGKEAARVVKSMPKWKPGKQNDSAVKVKVRAPVRFKLNK